MKIRELYESPQLVSPTDFNLNDYSVNKSTGRDLLKKKQEIIEDTPKYVLFRTGNITGGSGYIVQLSKEDDLIHYLVMYEHTNTKVIGRAITQVALWRKQISQINGGITTKIFFSYLLPQVGIITSDRQQTDAGRRFWERVMGLALGQNLKVGFIEGNKNVEYYDKLNGTFEEWLDATNGWTKSAKSTYDRYFIEQP